MERSERKQLVISHLEEVVTDEELNELLDHDTPRVYIGYAPTGELHIGHYTTIRKLADFLHAGFDVTVLIADLHAHLDDEKSPFDLLEARSDYYEVGVREMVRAAGADPQDITFVRGTDFQLDSPYTLELYRMVAETTISRAQRAGSEVVRQSENPKLGGLVYSVMQSLDVAALNADVAYGGIDQRGIYMLAREILPEHGHSKPVCAFAPLLSGLGGGKMSASDSDSTITITDTPDAVSRKINGAYCPQGEVEDNGILEYLRYLVFPILDLDDAEFIVERPAEYGGTVMFADYATLEAAFVAGDLHPADLKSATATHIAELLEPIRAHFDADPTLLTEAYPDEYGSS